MEEPVPAVSALPTTFLCTRGYCGDTGVLQAGTYIDPVTSACRTSRAGHRRVEDPLPAPQDRAQRRVQPGRPLQDDHQEPHPDRPRRPQRVRGAARNGRRRGRPRWRRLRQRVRRQGRRRWRRLRRPAVVDDALGAYCLAHSACPAWRLTLVALSRAPGRRPSRPRRAPASASVERSARRQSCCASSSPWRSVSAARPLRCRRTALAASPISSSRCSCRTRPRSR